MRNAVRALQAMIVAGAALIAHPAQADVLDEIVIAHRAGATSVYGVVVNEVARFQTWRNSQT